MSTFTLKDLQLGQSLGLGASILYFLVPGNLEGYFAILVLRLVLIFILFGPLHSIFDRRDALSLFAYTLGGFLIGIDLLSLIVLTVFAYEKLTGKKIFKGGQ